MPIGEFERLLKNTNRFSRLKTIKEEESFYSRNTGMVKDSMDLKRTSEEFQTHENSKLLDSSEVEHNHIMILSRSSDFRRDKRIERTATVTSEHSMNRSSATIDASDLQDSTSGTQALQVDRHNNVVRTNILDDGRSDAESLDLSKLPRLP